MDTSSLALKSLDPSHLQNLLNIELISQPSPWTQGIFLDCFKQGYVIEGVFIGDQLIAFGVYSLVAGEANLLNLCVVPDVRTQGVGRFLLRHLMSSAASSGALEMFLEVRVSNASAVALYFSEGFNEIGVRKNYYPSPSGGREDAFLMAATL